MSITKNAGDILPIIEKSYFINDYVRVIKEWEVFIKKSKFTFGHSDDIREKRVLQVLVVSYNEIQDYDKSDKYADIIISILLNERKRNWKDINFYFLSKATNYSRKKKWIREYHVYYKYIQLGGKNKRILNSMEVVESIIFNQYKKFNLYYSYIFILVIIAKNFLPSACDNLINSEFMLYFSILSIIWISLNLILKGVGFRIFKGILTLNMILLGLK